MSYDENIYWLGQKAKVLIDIHIEQPSNFDADIILDELIKEYVKRDLQPD